MKKAVIYSRKSKFKEEGESIENQINMCKEYAKNNLGIVNCDIFEDEGFSGKNTDRPQFQIMLKKIKAKKYTHFICYRLDRAFRNVADYSAHIELFKKLGVEFVSIKEQFDTTTALGRAMMNISATFAQLERETTAERISDNLRELAKTGRWLGGPAPVGYKSVEVENTDGMGKNRKKHILEILPEEIEIAKLVYKLFSELKSFQKVSRIIESNGIRSRKGRVFSRELVKQMITNPIYAIADDEIISYFKKQGCEVNISTKLNNVNGIMPYNRRNKNGSFSDIKDWIISVGLHPGIIKGSDWIKTYEIVKNIKASHVTSNRNGTGKALLSGLVVCAKCGSAMAPRQQKCRAADGTYTTYRYYTCNEKNRSSTRCSNTALDAYMAEDYVINKLMNITPSELIKNVKESDYNKSLRKNNLKLISDYKKDISNNNNVISKLVKKLAYMDDDPELLNMIKNEMLKVKNINKELEDKIKKLELENENLASINESIDDILQVFSNFKNFYNFTTDFEEKKRLIKTVVKFVTWNSDTRELNVVLVGSAKKRPLLHLSNRSFCTIDENVKSNINDLSIILSDKKRRNNSK